MLNRLSDVINPDSNQNACHSCGSSYQNRHMNLICRFCTSKGQIYGRGSISFVFASPLFNVEISVFLIFFVKKKFFFADWIHTSGLKSCHSHFGNLDSVLHTKGSPALLALGFVAYIARNLPCIPYGTKHLERPNGRWFV